MYAAPFFEQKPKTDACKVYEFDSQLFNKLFLIMHFC